MKRTAFFHIILLCTLAASAQNSFTCVVKNGRSGESLPNVSVSINDGQTATTDSTGKVIIRGVADGSRTILISSVGFISQSLKVDFPSIRPNQVFAIRLEPDDKEMGEVIISSTRTNTRIENNPTRVEVLGTEEVEEESGIKPSHIASLLGDIAGIQTQQTSAITGNTDLRIQGLPGDYTQILRDGMPLFGGYAGSFSILQLPPLDLKQIEIIKGASSTLYGGGAIAGMINVISKKPRTGVKERYLLFNQSTLRESNINMYLSERDKKAGYTFFGGGSYQHQVDVNGDGFSDVPANENFFIHPTFFYYPNEKNTISLGINSFFEDRRGGDMRVLNRRPTGTHQFYIESQSYRNTLALNWDKSVTDNDKLALKATTSSFSRNIATNVFGMRAKQLSYFTELSYLKKKGKHGLVAGVNISGERFRKRLPDSSSIQEYNYLTAGIFFQDDWVFHPKFILETGLRFDHHNKFGSFLLPRMSLLYKINSYMISRLGAGLGYKTPTVFSNEVDERDYVKLRLADDAVAERSAGVNWDVNYKRRIGNTDVAINQSFYYTSIDHPLVASSQPIEVFYYSETRPVTTIGMETWIQLGFNKLEAYLGYTLTDARKKYDAVHPHLSLSARNKFASVISYEISPKFRAIAEAAYTGTQYLDDGTQTPSFVFLAAMLRYDVGRCSFVLNGENLLDYRQTRKENILILPTTNPRFRQLWAPIDGVVFNLSLKIHL